MVSSIHSTKNLVVIELGAGTGIITKTILEKLPSSGRLISVEVDKKSAHDLHNNIEDSRLTIVCGSALELTKLLSEHDIKKVDYIISGLPLGAFSLGSTEQVLSEIKKNLHSEGVYVQFQYFLTNLKQIKKAFPHVSIHLELRNIPPAFVMTCRQ